MASLDEIVSVTITADSKTPSRQGFGTPLILSYHEKFAEQSRAYQSLAELTADGFTSADPAYRIAASVFSQNPTVERVLVGRLDTAPDLETTVTPTTIVEGRTVSLKVIDPEGEETPVSYVVPASATVDSVAAGVVTQLNAIEGIAAAATAGVITVTPDEPGASFYIHSPVNAELKDTTTSGGYDDALDAQELYDDNFYFVLIDSESKSNIDEVAAWTEARKKMFFASTSASDELSGDGDLGSSLQTEGYRRTALLFNSKASDFGGAGWVGVGGSQTPGSITWAFKSLAGVAASPLTTTQRTNLLESGINTYETIAGLNVTRWGTVAEGEYIDIVHGLDALEADIKESVFGLLANSPKVPYTTKGLDAVANVIKGALLRWEQTGLLVEDSSEVTMPTIESIPQIDKASRQLRNVRFTATLAGAIHQVFIVGTVNV